MTERVGFVGLGNMGGRIARRLVDAGVSVRGFDLREDSVLATGAVPAADLADAARGAGVVLMSLPDSRAVESVMASGLESAVEPGQVVVDLSTASPDSTRAISARLHERGVAYVDAGISGGASAAEAGTLTLMVGGDAAAVDRAQAVFSCFAARVFLIGPSGAGHTAKLLNNFLNAVSLSATAEVMVAARAAGLDLTILLDVLNNSSGVNFATLNRFPKIITGDYLEGGLTNSLMLKDVTLYVELLARLGVPSLHAAGPTAAFGLARSMGYADLISNTVVDAIGDLAGGLRIHGGEEAAS